MPTWSEILSELNIVTPNIFDTTRRKYIKALSEHTGRNTILYSTSWTLEKPGVGPELVSIVEEDLEAFMEVVHGLDGNDLDLILHSPGGMAEAAAAIVQYLRSKFKNIRVIIPHAAMSAATMLACASNSIVMGKHSFIGPTDPQFVLQNSAVAAQAILDQFELATKEITNDPNKVGVWLPILQSYAPALIQQAKDEIDLSKNLVSEWLEKYMLKGSRTKKLRAEKIATWLSDHHEFKSHGIHIDRNTAKRQGLRIENLEKDQTFQDLVLSVYHSSTITFSSTNATKIVENQHGKAFIKTLINQN